MRRQRLSDVLPVFLQDLHGLLSALSQQTSFAGWKQCSSARYITVTGLGRKERGAEGNPQPPHMEQAHQSRAVLLLPSRLNLQRETQEQKGRLMQTQDSCSNIQGMTTVCWFFVGFCPGLETYLEASKSQALVSIFLPAFQENFTSDFTAPSSACRQHTAR